MKKYTHYIYIILCILISGCASTPTNFASTEQDRGAKEFSPPIGRASLYIYRNENFGSLVQMPVTLNNKNLGETGGKTYFKINLPPGNYTISGQAENLSIAEITTEAGKNYFVWQEVKMGVWKARNQLKQVSESIGRSGVLESKLLSSLVSDVDFEKAGENKNALNLVEEEKKCAELGFSKGTVNFGSCVLKLAK